MNYLSVSGLEKSFGNRLLFSNISFGLNKGERMALLARNGAGKSTLLKIIAGQETADAGEVIFRKGISVSYLEQNPHYEENTKASSILFQGGNEDLFLIAKYHELIANQGDTTEILEQFEEKNLWVKENELDTILSKLQIDYLDKTIDQLSGGELKRLAIAKSILDEPDILVMDEPTNHLDIDMILWLEEFLKKASFSLLLVTHDRYFLDSVCNNIIEIEPGKLYSYNGNFDYYIQKKEERLQQQISELKKAKGQYSKELDWLRTQPKARTTKSKSRIQSAEKLEVKAKTRIAEDKVAFEVNSVRMGGKIVKLKQIGVQFGQQEVIKPFSYTFRQQERLGICGKNGSGKSTFLKVLCGEMAPTKGKVVIGETLVFGHYRQEAIKVDGDKRVIHLVKELAEEFAISNKKRYSASQLLMRFLFPEEAQQKFISSLSGGELRRLHLLTVLARNPNFLILDEPTNDLDILTMAALEQFLQSFDGVLVIVSHDRHFLDSLVDHIFIFDGHGDIIDYNGSYVEYKQEQLKLELTKPKEKAPTTHQQTKSKPDKLSYNEQRELKTLTQDIAKLEKHKAKLELQLAEPSDDHEKLLKLSEEIKEVIETLEDKTLRWFTLSDKSS